MLINILPFPSNRLFILTIPKSNYPRILTVLYDHYMLERYPVPSVPFSQIQAFISFIFLPESFYNNEIKFSDFTK
jgi:hypothetical protein